MHRSYRCIILAIVGWLSLAAGSPPEQNRASEKPQTHQSAEQSLQQIATALQRQNETGDYQRECPQGKDNRRSDLCAQWKAADAAYESSLWTRRAFWLVFAEIFIAAVTMGAAIAAARFAWLAAKAAQDQLTHAKDVAAEELRAYVFRKDTRLHEFAPGRWRVQSQLVNTGKTPALDVRSYIQVRLTTYPINRSHIPQPIPIESVEPIASVGPGAEPNIWQEINLDTRTQGEITMGRQCVFVRVALQYRIYGGEVVTEPEREMIAVGSGFETLRLRMLKSRDCVKQKEKRA